MTQIAYSASALQEVARYTNIQPTDNKVVAASKFVGGIALKTSVAALAALELAIRTASLILATPLHLLSNKTFTKMTETTKSAAKTILDATAALATIHAQEKKEKGLLPASKTLKARLNDALGYAQKTGNAVWATLKNNPKTTAAVIAGVITLITLYNSYPSIFAQLHQKPDAPKPTFSESPIASKLVALNYKPDSMCYAFNKPVAPMCSPGEKPISLASRAWKFIISVITTKGSESQSEIVMNKASLR